MKISKENGEWLKNILLPTKKASKVNKDILYRQQIKKEIKKVFCKFYWLWSKKQKLSEINKCVQRWEKYKGF